MPRRALDPKGACVACPSGDMICPHEQPLEAFLEKLLEAGCVPHYDEIDARFAPKRPGALLQLRRRRVFRLPGSLFISSRHRMRNHDFMDGPVGAVSQYRGVSGTAAVGPLELHVYVDHFLTSSVGPAARLTARRVRVTLA